MGIKTFVSDLIGDSTEESGEHADTKKSIKELKSRFTGFPDLEEPEGYTLDINSRVFVRWSGETRQIECKVMEDSCLVQVRKKETGEIKKKTVCSSVEEATEAAYSMMNTETEIKYDRCRDDSSRISDRIGKAQEVLKQDQVKKLKSQDLDD
jgi:hypothetical protein